MKAFIQALFAMLIAPVVVYAGVAGFIFQGVVYGFTAGREIFEEFFETEASKKKAVTS